MSVGPTRGPVQRPSDDRDFTEIFQRLTDLERGQPVSPSSGGDYVFLEELSAATDSSIQFLDIDQTYRHLVIEGSLYIDGDPGDTLANLYVRWGAASYLTSGYVSGQVRYYSTDNPTAAEGGHKTSGTFSNAGIIENVLPGSTGAPFAGAASLRLTFPYYRLTDRPRTMICQAVAFPFTPDDGIERAIAYGGAAQGLDGDFDPIERIKLEANILSGAAGLAEDAIASLYGIR